nr:GH25 family lysozyme [uncultured Olsenella sp.]
MIGIDVSSHDLWPFKANTEGCYRDSDFVIVKATQGTGYVNPYFTRAIERAESDGKLLGFYHYAAGEDPASEVEHLLSVASAWVGKAVPCLDWESNQNDAWGDDSWCRRFCEAFHAKTGVWPMVYVQASAIGQVASCHPECPLWVAGYPDMRNSWDVPGFLYGTSPWDSYAVWQFSSSNEMTDRNFSPLSRDTWQAMAAGDGKPDGLPDPLSEVVSDGIWWVEEGNLGYDQADRMTWEESGYQTGTEVDCSSFVIGLLRKHGYDVGGATYTGNMSDELCARGWVRIDADGSPRLGDVLLNDVHHVALSCGDGTLIQASRGEDGHRVSGGQAGDQDGHETNHRDYYDYPWDCYLRYNGQGPSAASGLAVDGWFGPATIRKSQEAFGTTQDGVISGQSRSDRLNVPCATSSWRYGEDGGSDLVRAVQRRAGVVADGYWGYNTSKAVQRLLCSLGYHVAVDGYFGHESCRAWQRAINDGKL